MIFPRESPRLGCCRITSVLITSILLTAAIQCSRFKSLALGRLLAVTFTIRRLWFSRPVYFRCMLSICPTVNILHGRSQFHDDVYWNRRKKAFLHSWSVIDTRWYSDIEFRARDRRPRGTGFQACCLIRYLIYLPHGDRRDVMHSIIAKKEENKNLTWWCILRPFLIPLPKACSTESVWSVCVCLSIAF